MVLIEIYIEFIETFYVFRIGIYRAYSEPERRAFHKEKANWMTDVCVPTIYL